MDTTTIPATAYVAIGALLAALIAGFFSFSNLVSAKENKVSEFRLTWINGLRDEISAFTAALQELARIEDLRDKFELEDLSKDSVEEREIAWTKQSCDPYRRAVENLTRIQLRLNPKHIEQDPDGPEAVLMQKIGKARKHFNAGEFESAMDSCEGIRLAAAPILKATWDLVKNGEPGYQIIRKRASRLIYGGGVLFAVLATIALLAVAI